MQTFLPYSDFRRSFECLDYQRLGKQRAETKQLCLGLMGVSNFRTLSHPASKMWSESVELLIQYGYLNCIHWIERGYVDNTLDWFGRAARPTDVLTVPTWIGSYNFHSSHRAALLQKNYAYYKRFDWPELINDYYKKVDYCWPLPSYNWRIRILKDDKEDVYGTSTGIKLPCEGKN